MSKNERAEQNPEKIIAQFKAHNPNWKAATTYEEFMKRVKNGKKLIYVRNAKMLNDQWNLFFDYPELLLFEDIRRELKTNYKANVLSGQKRMNSYEAAIERMASIARGFYADIIDWKNNFNMYCITLDKFDSSFIKETKVANGAKEQTEASADKNEAGKTGNTQKEKGSQNKNADGESSKRYSLNKEKLKAFAADKSPIENFVPDMPDAKIFLSYMKKRGILTLGDYITRIQLSTDKVEYFTIHNYFTYKGILQIYAQFRRNIGGYIDGYIDALELGTSGADAKQPETATVLDHMPELDGIADDGIATIVQLPQQEEGEDIYDWMRRLPCEFFAKGSASMKKIYDCWNSAKGGESQEYIEKDFTDEEVKSWADKETETYVKIIDEKRKEILIKEEQERERQRKQKLGAAVKNKFGSVEDYHHKPTLFNKVARRRYLKGEDDDLHV